MIEISGAEQDVEIIEYIEPIQVYMPNQLGFATFLAPRLDYLIGRFRIIHEKIENVRQPAVTPELYIYEPFAESEGLRSAYMERIQATDSYSEFIGLSKEFTEEVAETNREAMENSRIMAAILDGGHAVDDGVANEIGFYAETELGKIIALRTDERIMGPGEIINAQIESDIRRTGGDIYTDEKKWVHAVVGEYCRLADISLKTFDLLCGKG